MGNLEKILRSADRCGGCKNQQRHVYEKTCQNCTEANDLYALRAELKEIDERAELMEAILKFCPQQITVEDAFLNADRFLKKFREGAAQ